MEALQDWYELAAFRFDRKDVDKWKSKFPNENNEMNYLVERNAEWCKQVNIEYTPTIFVNGYLLREPYNYKMLKYHLRYLMEIGENIEA